MIVKFLKDYLNYVIGDVAGFEPATSQFLIEIGYAIEYVEQNEQNEQNEPPKRKRK